MSGAVNSADELRSSSVIRRLVTEQPYGKVVIGVMLSEIE